MAYRVSLSARAQRDLAQLYRQIQAEQSGAALRWYQGRREAILSLEEQPERCPATPENDRLRHFLFGHKPHIYRVIYRVGKKRKQVEVLHIRPRAMRSFRDLK